MNIYKKLFKVTSTLDKISKDTTNPFYKSKYFDINKLLEAVRPALIKEDLLLLQPIDSNQVGTRIVDIETGESVEAFIPLPDLQDPQKIGSCITYYRRYTLQSLLGIEAEDDDANTATYGASTPQQKEEEDKPWLNQGMPEWDKAEEYVRSGGDVKKLRNKYKVSKLDFEYFKSLADEIG